MKSFDLEREWNFVVSETHREKPTAGNLLKRETLFTIENLLSKISEEKNRKNAFLKEIYLKTKKQYFAMA